MAEFNKGIDIEHDPIKAEDPPAEEEPNEAAENE
jgi:hypothetical protein